MSDGLDELVNAIEKMNERLLAAEAQNVVLLGSIRKILIMQFSVNEEMKEAWDAGLAADREQWEQALARAKDEPTQRFMQAGIEAMKKLNSADIGASPIFRVIDGGRSD